MDLRKQLLPPTPEEIEEIGPEFIAAGPLPFGQAVENSRILTEAVQLFTAKAGTGLHDRELYIKAALVLGLQIGLRIGINRKQKLQ